jgi:hypothetical protein
MKVLAILLILAIACHAIPIEKDVQNNEFENASGGDQAQV